MNISEIDNNLRIDTTINEPDIVWLDAKQYPFAIHGVTYDNDGGRYLRMPDGIAQSVSWAVGILNDNTSGGRVRFRTNSSFIGIHAVMKNPPPFSHMPVSGKSGFDIYRKLANEESYAYYHSFVPPFGMTDGYSSGFVTDCSEAEYIINFPLYDNVKELYIALKKDALISPPSPYKYKKPIVYYGSSITQGGCASRPGNSYQAILSRRLDADFINLGFSGSCLAEDPMCEYLASLDMSVLVCDYDHNAPDPEHLQKTHFHLYETIRKAQPELPILFLSAPCILLKKDQFTERRSIIYHTYQTALDNGDKNVYFIGGEELFDGECWDSCTVDGTHPNDLGFYRMAMRIEETLKIMLEQHKK